MLQIDRWYGRLGNNIIQVVNALHIACHYGCDIKILPHKHFNTCHICLEGSVSSNCSRTLEPQNFYAPPDKFYIPVGQTEFDTNIYLHNKDKVQRILRSIFVMEAPVSSLDDNRIAIHIRTGDIFGARPHPRYAPPPLSYYTDILNQGSYDDIYIIAEDTKNPCIGKLKELYPRAIHTIQSLDKDIKIILSVKTVVMSVGTFIPSLLRLTDNVEKLHRFVDGRYTALIGDWVNSEKQRELMLVYHK